MSMRLWLWSESDLHNATEAHKDDTMDQYSRKAGCAELYSRFKKYGKQLKHFCFSVR